MKISKILNENKIIGQVAHYIFHLIHNIKKTFIKESEFQLSGDKLKGIYIPYHPIPESNLYGHIEILREYTKANKISSNLHIQHGVVLGNFVQKIMFDSFADKIITYSNDRKKLIEKETGKSAIAIGSYIKYAKLRLDKSQFQNMKNEMGKTLLVFPAHSSVDRTQINFDHLNLMKKINEIKKTNNIQTVLINLFYSDFKPATIELYRKEGFEVCSAGYWLSKNFLSNLRTLIELSDITMSNRVGTHVGYCLSFEKPHYIFKQEYKEDFLGEKGKEDLQQVLENEKEERRDTLEIESEFLKDDFIISNKQLEIVNKYWGNDIFYSPDELLKIIA